MKSDFGSSRGSSASADPGPFCAFPRPDAGAGPEFSVIVLAVLLLAGSLLWNAVAFSTGDFAWNMDLFNTEKERRDHSLYLEYVIPALTACLIFMLVRLRRLRRNLLRPFLNLPEIWIFAAFSCLKLISPIGGELERLPPFPHMNAGVTTLGLLLLIAAPVVLLPRWARLLALFALSAEISALLLYDLAHLRHLNFLPSVADIETGAAALTWESLKVSLHARDALLLLDLPFWIGWYALVGMKDEESRQVRFRTSAALLPAALILLIPAGVVMKDLLTQDRIHIAVRGDAFAVNATGLLGHHLVDIVAWWRDRRDLSAAEIEEVRRFSSERATTDSPSTEAVSPVAFRKHLILISLESLQDFIVDLEVEGVEITPHLNRLARRALLRASLQDVSGAGRSGDADFAALNGIHPMPGGGTTLKFAANRFHALPARLRERGYRAISLTCQEGYLWNSRRMHPQWGFERSLFGEELRPPQDLVDDDRYLYRIAMKEITTSTSPTMLFLHTIATHHPFPQAARTAWRLTGKFEGDIVGNYLAACHDADAALGEFLDGLVRSGLSDSTILAIYGDHDAGLYHEPELERLLGYAIDGEPAHRRTDRVPFLVVDLGQEASPSRAIGSQLDVAPTLLAVLNVGVELSYMVGVNLLRDSAPPVLLPDGSATIGNLLFTRSVGRWGMTYDLETLTPTAASADADLQRADRRFRISRLILEGDLIPSRP